MMILRNSQLLKLDEVPKKIFIEKLTEFISVNFAEKFGIKENFKEDVAVFFREAEKRGIYTEREIADFIIEELIKQNDR